MQSSLQASRRFVFGWLCFTTLLVGLWASPIVYTDAYGIFRKLGFPDAGMPPQVWTRLAAAERVLNHCDTVILGTSQAVFSFGVEPFEFHGDKICNGAIGGGTIHEIHQATQMVLANDPPKRVVLVLDFIMYHDKRHILEDFSQSRYNTDRSRLTYYAWAATSFGAFTETLTALQIETPWHDNAYRLRPQSYTATRGNLRAFLKWPKFFRDYEGPEQSITETREILDLLREHNVETLIILPSVHAYHFESLRLSRLWPAYRKWKTALIALTSSYDPAFTVWDFQSYNRAVVAPLPLLATDPVNPFFCDAIHPSENLGMYMYQRILDEENPDARAAWDANFGTILTADNVQAQLDQMEADRETWVATHPREVELYRSIVAYTVREAPKLLDDWEASQVRWNADDHRLTPAERPDKRMMPMRHYQGDDEDEED